MFVRALSDLGAADIELVGGKAANLGELVRAGFPVPTGFVLTTEAYRLAARAAGVDPLQPARTAEQLRGVVVPAEVRDAALAAYATLGRGPVAVRSSATAEDLPLASFAGQQDSYLDVQGDEALLDAIRRCWASLWNERATAYRYAYGIDHNTVSLAVVVQRMVPAAAAGVIFTADPLTGRRRRASIDAIAGLGEKLVSGAVNPDHYVVDPATRQVVEGRPSGAEAVLSTHELLTLAALGDAAELHFGVPQDIEFALDLQRSVWLVQSRPITTLFPLPADLPDPRVDLRVFFSANVFQGYFEPLTPMGTQFFQLVGTAVYRAFGAAVPDPEAGPRGLAEAAMRLFIDITPVMRDRLGRRIFESATKAGEARTSAVVARLGSDERLALTNQPPMVTGLRIGAALTRVGVPLSALWIVVSPGRARTAYERQMDAIARVDLPPDASAESRLDAYERLVLEATPRLLPRLLGIMAPAIMALGVASWLLRGRAREDELQTLTRAAPHNPTTEMDLMLWSVSVKARRDPDARAALLERSPSELAAAYRASQLPVVLQHGLSRFLARYGFRAIGEIDIGTPRWSEDPTHILGALSNYVRLGDDALAPDVQFARAQHEAEAMVATLLQRVSGPRRVILRLVLRRLRQLIGSREAPKFHIMRLLATPSRELLRPVGAELVRAGRLERPQDVFFLTLAEARRAVAGDDLRPVVAARRQVYQREQARNRVPRVLLSDGTDAEFALTAPGGDGLVGSPASPGVVTGPARVILSPQGAQLEPGEILVAPSTDPGWTPLFLTAGGLVMEMGGMMSHGAVVAREYGIPAVVGVAGVTERLVTGQRVTVDGSTGTVKPIEDQP
jgi:pyruvate,water dikinase